MITETIFVKSSSGDRYGNQIGSATTRAITDCRVWPRTSGETSDGGNIPIGGFNIFAPAGTEIRDDEIVTVRGKDYEVEGTPGEYLGRGLWVVTKRVGR